MCVFRAVSSDTAEYGSAFISKSHLPRGVLALFALVLALGELIMASLAPLSAR